ncbi:MAG: Crp/Fnr family transcriptional regulator [Cyclobacteriaceae bacterium]|nr:Crp/Fnr family transcriptional regulator [Cyclobacteriaceae bacterium]
MEKEIIILERILNAYSPVTPAGVSLVMENGSIEACRKNDVIFPEKRFNAFEYFQLEGISHRYNSDEDQQALTTGIFMGETVITPHFTRTQNSQSIFALQALTDCVFLKVPAGTFSQLMDQHDQIRRFGRSVVEKEFVKGLQYEVIFRSFSAKDRLTYFRTHYPNLENIIPHTVIASFLGITPVSFSRLRGESAKK